MKSKTGEIERRILQSEKIVNSIAEKDECSVLQSSPEVSRSNKKDRQLLVFRLRQEVVQLTRDVQHLSRFIGVQRTGFRKLLKKYKKWSDSSSLSERFLPVLESPSSFTNKDFTPIFLELSLLYNVLRQAKITSINANTSHTFQSSNETISRFDCEMVTSLSSSVIFWIHPDNLVEAKVALLKNLSLVSNSSLPATASYTNLAALNETALHNSDTSLPADQTFTTFLDNTKKFYSIQTNSEPGQIKIITQPDKTSTPVLCSPVGGLRHFCMANLSDEQQNLILHSQFEALSGTLNKMDNISKMALSWVQKRHASPIAKVLSQRTRFRYLEKFSETVTSTGSEASSPNTYIDSPDIWATMDNNVKFSKLAAAQPEWNEEFEDTTEFPYCILEIRWKGMNKPLWISDLERSHLVYPIKGFSTYAFTVAQYYPEVLSVIPKWMETINNNIDIRRSPSSRNTIRRGHSKSSISLSSSQTTPAPVVPGILLNNERQPLLRTSSRSHGKSRSPSYGTADKLGYENERPDQPVVRYWNEFDDPEDGQDDGVFVVIPDEDLEDGLLNDDDVFYLVSLGESILNKTISLKQKFVDFFGGHKKPLKKKRGLSTICEENEEFLDNEEEEETEFEGYYSPRFKSHHEHGATGEDVASYFDMRRHSAALEQRNSILSALYSICFFLSAFIVCILFGVLLGEDMDAITMGTYIFIVAGFFVALAISVLAMGLFLMRSDMPVWWHQTIVFATFFSIICFGVGGIAWLFS